MTGASSDDIQRTASEDEKFEQVFGVSKVELRAQGVDVQLYVKQNIKKALKRRHNMMILLPEQQMYHLLFSRWGYRAFLVMIGGIGFLALSKVSELHVLGIAGAVVFFMAACIAVGLSLWYKSLGS
jgi:hypothetical protein